MATILDELKCGCCYEVMVNPTTLTCGHSFCRYCLAKWFNTSEKTECLGCRQIWAGFPQVNVQLRTILEKSYPLESERQLASQTAFEDYTEVIKKFEELGKQTGPPSRNADERLVQGIINLFLLAICVLAVLAIIGVLYYFITSGSKTKQTIYYRPVDQWTPYDVEAWTRSLTKQFGYDYSVRFFNAQVDGQLLLGLTEEDLASLPLNISVHLHRKILIVEIMKLNMTRIKYPTNLWEYKDAHQGNVLFLIFMLQDSPRLTFVYLHYMEYHTIFLPFLRAVLGIEQCGGDETTCLATEDDVTVFQKLRFYYRVILFPYYQIIQYSLPLTDTHFLTTWLIISHCVMLTFGEFSRLHLLPEIIRNFPRRGVEYVVTFIITCIWYWSLLFIVPSFLLNIVFYGKLCYGPYETANKMRDGEFHANILGKVLYAATTLVQAVFRIFTFFRRLRT